MVNAAMKLKDAYSLEEKLSERVLIAVALDSFLEIRTQTLLLVGLGPSSEEHAMAELRPVRHQSGLRVATGISWSPLSGLKGVKPPVEFGPKPHPHDATLGESSREAQSGRRLLGTNGVSLWLWCCLPQPGALGP